MTTLDQFERIAPFIQPWEQASNIGAWRRHVLERDRCCQECGATDNLEVDHIAPRSRCPEMSLVLLNGRVLCRSCHQKTDTWGRRALRWPN